MASAATNLIAAVARMKHTSNLIVANQNNTAHLAAILRDVEFDSDAVEAEFVQMDMDRREWFLEQVYKMQNDSLIADDLIKGRNCHCIAAILRRNAGFCNVYCDCATATK